VKENARLYQTSFLQELYRVIFHGALHLCGYKDKSDKDVKLIRSKEDYYLSQYVSRETRSKRSNI
jgi:rRNA maturation RNase YbeY